MAREAGRAGGNDTSTLQWRLVTGPLIIQRSGPGWWERSVREVVHGPRYSVKTPVCVGLMVTDPPATDVTLPMDTKVPAPLVIST